MFEEEIVKLSRSDQDTFAHVVNSLLLSGFVVRDQFDTREKTMKINPSFRFLERYYELVNDYLSFAGWEIDRDLINGVFALKNEYRENRAKLDRETSLITFVLRLIYESEKSESSQTGESIYVTTPQVQKVMLDRGILLPGKKLTGRLVDRCLRILAGYNIINKVSGSYDEGNVSFYILPSILYAVDSDMIAAMGNALDQINAKQNDGGSIV
ncbi:MAG: DUF4194 domain-containing protein [Bacilli bacterium]|jgi:hypothetical protein|nr:DUF4194 domain-containing protein [Bacilli bacterium]